MVKSCVLFQPRSHAVYICTCSLTPCPVEKKGVKVIYDGYLGLSYRTDYPFQHSEKWKHAVTSVRRMDGEDSPFLFTLPVAISRLGHIKKIFYGEGLWEGIFYFQEKATNIVLWLSGIHPGSRSHHPKRQS